jgi:serine phosphatase RsbU (regulator of sigma subunit)
MEITQQKQLLEKSNKQVMSSINYAMRIQRALLMSQQTIDKLLPQNFILYLPRDVVSGDFYYIREVNNHILVVAADCTGHGVPGAFMSMLGISFLNEIVQNSSIEMTNLVLDTLREKVISSFAGSETRDGMDLSMVVIQREKGVVHFSGAYNNLWVVRGADKAGGLVSELEEIKGDSMPIGVHPKDDVPFAMKELTLSKGDTFYLFSDGYHSQFGGPRYDKFKTKNFKQLIHSISNLPMSEQKSILEQRLMEWRGYSEQTDDVLVIGVRV